jgi:hypothetical protein
VSAAEGLEKKLPLHPSADAATGVSDWRPLRLNLRRGKRFDPTSAGESALPSRRVARVSAGDRPARMAAPVAAESAIIARSLTRDPPSPP